MASILEGVKELKEAKEKAREAQGASINAELKELPVKPRERTASQPLNVFQVAKLVTDDREQMKKTKANQTLDGKERFLSNVRKAHITDSDLRSRKEEEEGIDMESGSQECIGKLFIICFLMSLLFICVSSNNLALVSFKDHLSKPVAVGQLYLMFGLPAFVVFVASLCTMLVREGKNHSTERQLSTPAVLCISIVEALVSSATEALFVFYILPKAQGSVTLLLLAIAWNVGPLLLLSILGSFSGGPHEYTPLGLHIPPFVVRVCICVATAFTIIAIAFAMVTSKLWWQTMTLVALASFAHWENYFEAPLPVQRSLSSRRFFRSSVREFTHMTVTTLIFMLFAWQSYDMSPSDFFGAIAETPTSDTERAFYIHIATGFVGYFTAWIASMVFSSRMGVGLPLLLATPVCVVLHETLLVKDSRFFYGIAFSLTKLDSPGKSLIPAAVALGIAGACGALYYLFQNRNFSLVVLLSEKDLFSRPGYEPLLQQSLSLNSLRPPRFKAPVKQKISVKESDPFRHKTFILATMWHEGEEEMRYVVESLAALSHEVQGLLLEEYETHIVFDDAIKDNDANQYVQTLFKVFRDAEFFIEDPVETWYGYVVHVRIEGAMTLHVHLKNVQLVKQKKRWSQNLAIEVILTTMCTEPLEKFEQTYLLLLDGDTRFKKKDVDILRGRLVEEPDRVGAVCGRIIPDVAPENTNPIVWYQKFEYAASHWLQKASEHVFGSVFCCPGCFTLVRFSALVRRAGNPKWSDWEDTPLAVYNLEADSAMSVLMLEQGEDRMLSTQLVRNGWLLQYCSDAAAVTFCPDSFNGFFTQRRRWNTSTVANIYYLLAEAGTILSRNGSISLPYIISTLISLLVMLVGPAMIVVITVGAISYALRIDATWAAIVGVGIPLFYLFICIVFHIDMSDPNPKKKSRKFEIQTGTAFVLAGVYFVIMGIVMVGIMVQLVNAIVNDEWTPDILYVILHLAIYIIGAIIHGETSMLLHLPIYLLFTPTFALILPIFCVMNLHDMSWGTRDAASKDAVVVKEDLGFFKFGWRNLRDLCCRAPEGLELTPAARWLAEQNLSEYIPALGAQGYDTLESVATIHPDQYEQLGIKLGHRAQFRSAITRLGATFNAPLRPAAVPSLLNQAKLRKQRHKKEQELTALFHLVRHHKLREFLKRIHESLKFAKVDATRQKTELADMQKRAGYSVLVVSFIVLAITVLFSTNFGADELQWGFLRVQPARIPGYAIVLLYSILMIAQFIGMCLYRFGILLYTICRWRVRCKSAIIVGDDRVIVPMSTNLSPSTSYGSQLSSVV